MKPFVCQYWSAIDGRSLGKDSHLTTERMSTLPGLGKQQFLKPRGAGQALPLSSMTQLKISNCLEVHSSFIQVRREKTQS